MVWGGAGAGAAGCGGGAGGDTCMTFRIFFILKKILS